ncbi:response regulator, partial [Streptococcus hyovaginalis]
KKIKKINFAPINGFKLTETKQPVYVAINLLKKKKIGLIRLDIFMPGKIGVELCAYLRKNDLVIDVIVILAASDLERIKKALRHGVVDYLIKPFEFERFNTALTTYLEQARITNKQASISQQELDTLLLHREESVTVEELPKGLTKDTLKQVWEAVQKLKEEPFSTDDAATLVG